MSAFAGRFELDGLLGSGATASVYSARDTTTGETVAVKVLHPRLSGTAAERDAFFAEAAAAARVDHPGVPAVLGHGVDEGGGEPRAWIATARAPGRTLARLVEADGPLDPGAALALAARLLDALAAVHAAGLVHRDVAPGNVVVADDGAVCLLDFGLADAPGRAAVGGDVLRSGGGGIGNGAASDSDGGVIGSVNYLSPEQALGAPVDERGDLYQAAGLLHFALTGRPPFPRATAAQTMAAHVSAPPPVPSALDSRIPQAADEIVVRGLMKQPEARYASAAAMAAAVRAVLGESAPPALGSGGTSVLDTGTALLRTTVPVASTVPTASSVFIGPGGVLVDREAATTVIPRGRRTPERGSATPAPTVRPPARRAEPAAAPRPLPAPTGAARPAAAPAARPGRTALAVTAGAVAVAATIWLVAANAAPTAPPTMVAVPSAAPPVVSATPTAKPTVAPAETVPQDVPIPELAGLSRADAAARLAAAGLTAGSVTSRDGIAAAGTVLQTQPASGVPAAPGTAVALVVASGRNAVPELHGQTMLAAGATLSAAGFAVVERSVVDSTVPDRTVLGSEPGAGTVIALGETVTVVVSRLPAQPTTTPTPAPTTTPQPTRPPAP
ncbi:serine/threonine-protein kinase [Leifsonia naganoensis]|uniref:non-specific serine/threonine protein kinase n=1 Tax=Leifsonia naganoensis TaxID=150025 RepID=A0A853DQU7_9MICO|nr:serine/threonine-protein kinase [Leifsonia naganoensis]NYK09993.1 serine/threonine-protein kinase [Leifsonia naganoensis]